MYKIVRLSLKITKSQFENEIIICLLCGKIPLPILFFYLIFLAYSTQVTSG